MNKRILVVTGLVAFAFLAVSNTSLLAQEKKAVADPSAARKAAEERGRLALGAKEWDIEAKSTDPSSKSKSWSDVLNLNEGKLSSKHLGDKGFVSSNITVTVESNGAIVWETMQRGEKGEIAFWRGELSGDTMSGVVSLKPEKGETEEFAFTNAAPAPVKAEPPKPKAPTAPAKAEPNKKR